MILLLDIILVLIFLLVVIISARRGFVKCIWSVVTIIGAFVFSYMFGPTLGVWIGEAFVCDYVSSYSYEVVESIVEEKSDKDQYDVPDLFDTLPEDLISFLEHCGVDIDDITSGLSTSVTVSQDELYTIADSIASRVSKTISNVSGIIIVFLASIIIISLLGLILKLLVKVPIIKPINTFFGMILGIVEGFVIVWILCWLVELVVENETFHLITDSSYLFKFFRNLSLTDFINIRIE